MRYLIALAVTCLLQTVAEPAGAETSWQVKTENGVDLVIGDVKVGRFEIEGAKRVVVGKDSRGQPVTKQVGGTTKFIEASMTLPMKDSSAFGFRFRLPGIPAGDRIVLTVQTTAPGKFPSPKGPTNVVVSTMTYTDVDAGKPKNWFWRFGGSDNRTMLGTWVRRISQKGRALAEATFTVVAP